MNQIETHPFHQQVETQESAMTNMIPEVAVLARRFPTPSRLQRTGESLDLSVDLGARFPEFLQEHRIVAKTSLQVRVPMPCAPREVR